MHRYIPAASLALAAALFATTAAVAQSKPPDEFYKGNTVTVVVSSGSGGENALYGKTIGGFIGRHIPGKPTVIMQYMPGGGGIKGANYCYNVAPKDGTILCHLQYSLAQTQLLGMPGVKFDVTKFDYLGRSTSSNSGIYVWHSTPPKTLADVKKHEIIIGASGRGSETFTDPTLINAVLGTKFKVILGYKGGGDMDLALERGEVNGDAGPAISVFNRHRHWVDNNKIRFLVQSGEKRHPLLPDVPLLTELAETPDQKAIFAFLSSRAAIGRTLVASPGVPADRLAALRKAYRDTVHDPAYVKEAKRRGLDVIPASHEEVETLVREVLATPPETVRKVKTALGIKG
ncbi:MAG: hypothetical protein GEU92_02710 [Alphaproteobacteria bacterium]|nr:hypothetical protein [Alphaproteobacteria bacterium]